jgi:chemotaxis protein methyltransferase CheR
MNPADFQFVAEFLKRRSGLALKPDKIPLVKNRFAALAERHGFADVDSFVHQLKTAGKPLARAATDAMTTNDTWFFRDK